MIDIDDVEELGLQPGDELEGDYRIEGVVGEGGFSTVYRATQTSLGRTVAIKWMKTRVQTPDDSSARALDDLEERFRREARIVARLDHPATVTLHDFGRTAGHDLYMVLEYVDGVPLTAIRGPHMAPNRVAAILEQALESLGEAHDAGVIHRDIKPDNLMVYHGRHHRERLKILDFGIAKVLRSIDERTLRQITGESTILGTPRYIAPENATDRDPGPAADIYSLGLVAYELLLGERAVPGDDTLDILDRHLAENFQVRIPERPAVPDRLRRIVNRMVAKPLSERYGSADQVLDDLRALPEYGDAYGPTDEVRRPPETGPETSSAPDPAIASTDSLPEVSAYGETPDFDAAEPASRSSGPSHDKKGDAPGTRTARERPMPPTARASDDEDTDDRDATGPTRRASFPPGQTHDLPGGEVEAIEKETDAESSDERDEDRSTVTLVAAVAVIVTTFVVLGFVVI